MGKIVLGTDWVETLFGLVAVVIWITANFINARKRQGQRPPPSPVRRSAESPAAPERSPEDELREFLESLGRPSAPAEPELPPPPPIPTPAEPGAEEAEAPARPVITAADHHRPRHRVRHAPVTLATPAVRPAMSVPAVAAVETAVARRAQDLISSFRMPAVALPGTRGMMPMPSLSMSSAGGGIRACGVRQLGLNQKRELRRAMRLQAILSTPAGLR